MGLLESIKSPRDLTGLNPGQLTELAKEIRAFLVENVSRTGGHLGPNLGVVELTLAMHRVFDSPHDTFVFDTGHQSYVHKLLTGRQDFSGLRHEGGLSGYPSRVESEHDVVENSHASTSLSWADGVAKANQLSGAEDRHVVAVIGDGALTGGMAWEAINNIAQDHDRRLVLVVNDNGRSYAPTIGGLAHHLDTLRTTRGYESFLRWGKRALHRTGRPGRLAYGALHGLKKGIKDVVAPQGMFEDLGLKYLGPVDGHDVAAVERVLTVAREYGGPVIVHVITEKGRGYTPAEQDVADRFHGIGPIHPETGLPVAPSRFGWTSVFSEEMVQIGRERPDVAVVSAAMVNPVGLSRFAESFPSRAFDVGIAEQHAITSAAGMAFAGLHPVVALYATFLNRAFDQLLMDAALHRAGITVVLDRSGVTGNDGPSHNGMWDLALLRIVPGIHVAAPRDEATLRSALRDAVEISDAPSVVRYPKGPVGDPVEAVDTLDGVDVLAHHEADAAGPRLLLVGIGAMAAMARDVAVSLAEQGVNVLVVSPTWVLPMPSRLVKLTGEADLVMTIEDGLAAGGVGALLGESAAVAGIGTTVRTRGLPTEFLSHASRSELFEKYRLTVPQLVQDALTMLSH